jgi:hypothetical protein
MKLVRFNKLIVNIKFINIKWEVASNNLLNGIKTLKIEDVGYNVA